MSLFQDETKQCGGLFLKKKDPTQCTPKMAVELTDSILQMIVKDMRPLAIVEGQGFGEMINTLPVKTGLFFVVK